MPWLIVGGVLAAYLFFSKQASGGGAANRIGIGASSAGTTGQTSVPLSAASKAPTGGVVGGALSTINNISTTGCAKIASSKGVPSGLATTGCQLWSYVTPIGLATTAYKYGAPALTYVGSKAVSAGEAVGSAAAKGATAVGNVIASGAKDVYHDITSWL